MITVCSENHSLLLCVCAVIIALKQKLQKLLHAYLSQSIMQKKVYNDITGIYHLNIINSHPLNKRTVNFEMGDAHFYN